MDAVVGSGAFRSSGTVGIGGKNPQNKELADIFLLELNINPDNLKFIDEEVTDAKFYSIPQIQNFLNNPESKVVNREEYPYIFHYLLTEKDLQS